MIQGQSDSELGRHLLTLRSFQWLAGCQGDPYALLLRAESDDRGALGAQVRERGELYESSAGAWVTGRYRAGARVLDDPRLQPRHADLAGPQVHLIRSDVWESPKMCHIVPVDDAFLTLDRAECARLGALVDAALGGGAEARLRAVAERAYEKVLGGTGPEPDLMTDLARPAAVAVVRDLFGVPEEAGEALARHCDSVGVALDAGLCPPRLGTARETAGAIEGVRDVFVALIGQRRAAPGDDAVSDLIRAATAPGDPLAVCVLAAVAGVELAANLVCNAMAALLDHPEQWRLLCEQPDLAPAAVEEALRFDPPAKLASLVAREDLALAGHDIPAGGQVVVLIDAANRDPDQYTDPDRFDLTRTTTCHLSLSGGLYASLMAPLVRSQAAAALRAMASQVPGIRRAGPALCRLRSPVVRGTLRFPVAIGVTAPS